MFKYETTTGNTATARAGMSDDVFFGGQGIDLMYGNAGRDRFHLDLGDQAFGSDGNDRFDLEGSAALIDGGSDTDTVRLKGTIDLSAVNFRSIERFEVMDGLRADFSTFSSGARVEVIETGNATNMTQVVGSDFDDTIVGSEAVEEVSAGDGNDVLFGGAGDSLFGEAGDDVIQISEAAALVSGGAGSDKLIIKGHVQLGEMSIDGIENILISENSSLDAGQNGSELVGVSVELVGNGIILGDWEPSSASDSGSSEDRSSPVSSDGEGGGTAGVGGSGVPNQVAEGETAVFDDEDLDFSSAREGSTYRFLTTPDGAGTVRAGTGDDVFFGGDGLRPDVRK